MILRAFASLALLGLSTTALANDPPLPLQVCDGNAMVNVAPEGSDFVWLQCENFCVGDFEACTDESEVTDVFGSPLREVTFTVDGMVGRVRYNKPDPELGITAGIVIHPGGNGTKWKDTNRDFWSSFERDGVRIIGIRWYSGILDPLTGSAWGWLTKKSAPDGGFADVTRRPAEVLKWVRGNLVPADKKIGVVGHSNGSLAVMGALHWHGVHDAVDYLLLNSGATRWDIELECRTQAGFFPPNGLCENNPALVCSSDTDCGGSADKCAFPFLERNAARRMDYRLDSGTACREGDSHPNLLANGMGTSPGEWTFDFPVDVLVAEDPPRRPETGDTAMGLTWELGNVYNAIQTTHPLGKRWLDYHGYRHGAAGFDPELLPAFECTLRRGMNIEPLCTNDPTPASP
jgi:hypothetical protein